MKERPILFSAPMVRAILDGTKTQLRRIVKPQPQSPKFRKSDAVDDGREYWVDYTAPKMMPPQFNAPGDIYILPSVPVRIFSPYGQPGDRLWVRETFISHPACAETGRRASAIYRADGGHPEWYKWDSPVFMPRKHSRITLEVVSVRVQRLQDIGEEDARAEGARFVDHGDAVSQLSADGGVTWGDVRSKRLGWSMEHPQPWQRCLGSARMAFASLWNTINGPKSWTMNPWVWVVEFRRVTP